MLSPCPSDVRFAFRQSEISAKLEPAHPGEALSQLLKGELGVAYKPAIGVLWEGTEGEPPPSGLVGVCKISGVARFSVSAFLSLGGYCRLVDWLVGWLVG